VENKDEIIIIECTIRSIFQKEIVTKSDVDSANRLYKKWKQLTNHKEDNFPAVETILEKEPNWQLN